MRTIYPNDVKQKNKVISLDRYKFLNERPFDFKLYSCPDGRNRTMICAIPAKYTGFRVLHHRYEIVPVCVLSYTVTVAIMYAHDVRIIAQLYIVFLKCLYFLRYLYLFSPLYSSLHSLYFLFSFFIVYTHFISFTNIERFAASSFPRLHRIFTEHRRYLFVTAVELERLTE